MFESTVSLRKSSVRGGRWTLPISVATHAVVIAAAIILTTWNVSLPADTPAQPQHFYAPAIPPAPPIAQGTPEGRRDSRGNRAEPRVTPTPPQSASVSLETREEPLPAAGDGEREAPLGHPDGVEGGSPDGAIDGIEGGVPTELPPPPAPRIFEVGGNVNAPQVIVRVQPEYPKLARTLRREGTVVLRCIIDRSGEVQEVQLVSTPDALLADAAMTAVRQWRFSPGTLNGAPVAVVFEFTVVFELD